MSKKTRKQGPEVKRLICHRMARLAIPDDGGVMDGLKFLCQQPDGIMAVARDATDWAFAVIDGVKAAGDNPYGDDDEAIAAEINRQVEERRWTRTQKRNR